MIKLVCIGYDIRSAETTVLSTDATVWPIEESFFEEAKENLGLIENEFQLLHILSQKTLSDLTELVTNRATVISLWIPKLSLEAIVYTKFKGFQKPYQSESGIELGIDIADYNGLFSIFHMGVSTLEGTGLLASSEITEALQISQAANFWVPSHSPFVTMLIKQE